MTPDRPLKRTVAFGMVRILLHIDAEMSAEPMPFDCERIVVLRLRAAHHDGEVT